VQVETGFAPLINPEIEPKVLILGSMPGVRSLQDQQYYAHPQNSFWWIMAQLFEFDMSLDYDARIELVLSKGLMVWDVAYSCHRPGSLDADIDTATLVPNSFDELFDLTPSIQMLAFNGQAARKLFKQHVESSQSWSIKPQMQVMPSTSPAYAAMRKQQKLEHWRSILEYL